jgi:hypothetical protein
MQLAPVVPLLMQLLLLYAPPTNALSPSALLRKLHAHHIAASPPTAFRPDEQYAPLRDLLAASEASVRGTAGAAAELVSMGPMYQRAATDGELLEEGVEQLLDLLRPTPDACFADLGSGRAEALMHVAARGVYRGCFGIELVEARHSVARRLLAAAVKGGMLLSAVRLVRGDLAEIASLAETELREAEDASAGVGASSSDAEMVLTPPGAGAVLLRDTTHAFACSVCYDDVLLRAMTDALTNRRLFPRFQLLISLRALPSAPGLVLVGETQLTTSWNGAARARVYVPTDLLDRPEHDLPVPALARLLCAGGVCTLPPRLQWEGDAVIRLPRL